MALFCLLALFIECLVCWLTGSTTRPLPSSRSAACTYKSESSWICSKPPSSSAPSLTQASLPLSTLDTHPYYDRDAEVFIQTGVFYFPQIYILLIADKQDFFCKNKQTCAQPHLSDSSVCTHGEDFFKQNFLCFHKLSVYIAGSVHQNRYRRIGAAIECKNGSSNSLLYGSTFAVLLKSPSHVARSRLISGILGLGLWLSRFSLLFRLYLFSQTKKIPDFYSLFFPRAPFVACFATKRTKNHSTPSTCPSISPRCIPGRSDRNATVIQSSIRRHQAILLSKVKPGMWTDRHDTRMYHTAAFALIYSHDWLMMDIVCT